MMLVILLIVLVPLWRIVKRTGHSGWWSFLVYKAESCNLYIPVKEEGNRYVAEFFTVDDMFVQTWAVSRDSRPLRIS
jgi:hypothetical protein